MIWLLPFLSIAQTPDALIRIINDTVSIDEKQQQIDSFFLLNQTRIPLAEMADCYHDIGSKWYYSNWKVSEKNTDLKKAIKSTRRAFYLKGQLQQPEECSLNKTLFNLGYFLFLDNQFHKAIDIYHEIVEKGWIYCEENSEKDVTVKWALQELGTLYLMTGDFYRSIDSYNILISSINAEYTLQPNDYQFLIYSHLQLADLYFQIDAINNLGLVKKHLGLAQKLLSESGLPCCEYQVHINQQYGNALLDVKNYTEALSYLKKALGYLSIEDSLNLAIVNNSLGISYLNLDKDIMALKSFDKAIAYNNLFSDPYNNLGDFYIEKEDFKRAIKYYQKAIDLEIGKDIVYSAASIPSIEELQFVPDKIPLLNHIITKANGWIKYYVHDSNKEHLNHALETFTLADQLVDLIRYTSNEQQSKLYWREKSTSLYMKAVEVCYLLKQPEEAFYFMERNKALLLLEDLTNEEAKAIANLPRKLVQREFNLKRKIYLSENNLMEADNTNTEMISPLKDSIRENKYRYEQYVDSLNQSYPEYAKFKKKVAILSLDELKSDYISNKHLVLHYILNEDDGYGLLSSKEGSFLFQLIEVPQLNDQIDTLITLLADGNSDITTYNTTSNALFKKLIPQDIYTKIKGRQLTIIPDYTLQRLPFEALAVSTNGPKYLLEEVAVSYDYSLSLLKQNSSIQRKSGSGLLAFAPVQFTALGLTELPFSESEVKELAEIVPGDIQLHDKATKKAFLEQMKDHKIIHLATHADLGDGENPWIAFADDKMFLKEIYATKNQAKMVVLSACNTLDGELKRGEGIMSLARGFFYSGAESVVSSLWPVNDNVGKEILIKFYQNLDQGDTKSKALQKAKLKYLNTVSEKKLKHPYYWAGFVVLGNNEPLNDDQRSLWYFMGMGILIVALLYVALKLFKIVK